MGIGEPIHIIVDSIPESATTWIDTLSALLVPTIAIIGAYIAYQQYRINRQRLRHETYERRLSVYKVVRSYLSEILRDGETTYDRALEFSSEASEASFLFGESVQDKIDEIYKHSIRMIKTQKQMYPDDGSLGLPVGEERNKVVEENATLLNWHCEQLKEIRKLFAKKIGLKIT